jgi:hypothetical protein
MEEFAESFAGNEAASQAGAGLKTMVAGATADALRKALEAFGHTSQSSPSED